MMIYHLDDGTCIHTSLISMPETVFTQLEFGYVVTPLVSSHIFVGILADHHLFCVLSLARLSLVGQWNIVFSDGKNYAVDRIHLNLADVGEVKGEFPQYFNYTFEAGPLKYDVKVNCMKCQEKSTQ